MADANPFSALLPTGENLAAEREARFNQNPGASFWAIEAGRAGLDLRRELVRSGTALSPADERAIAADRIVSGAQQRLAELVKNGDIDPLDAQEQAITETMSAFMTAGDVEAAQSLLPELNQIRTFKGEQAKLRSETEENQATTLRELTTADVASRKLPSQISLAESQADLARARADLARRTDRNLRAAGKKGKDADLREFVSDKARSEVQTLGAATMTLFSVMGDLSDYMDQAPRGASAVAAGINYGNQYLAGVASLFKTKGMSTGLVQPGGRSFDLSGLSSRPEDGLEGVSPRTIVKANEKRLRAAADSLSMDVTAFTSLVIDAAYSLARANDPGGRLSNNDFDFALQMLGAVQDPASAKNAFRKLVDRQFTKYNNIKRSFSKDIFEANFADMDANVLEDYARFDIKRDSSGNLRPQAAATAQGSGTVAGRRPPEVQAIIDAAAAARAAQGQ